MKRIAVLLVLVVLLLGACGSKNSGSAVLNQASSLIPEQANVIGSADIPGLLKLDLAKKFSKDAEFEKKFGVKVQDLGVLTFWVIANGQDTDGAFFTKGISIDVIKKLAKENTSYQGTDIYTLGNANEAAAELAGQIVVGTPRAIKASIDASKGKSLASSGRANEFSDLLNKTSGLLTIAFIPDATVKEKLDENSKSAGPLEDFVKSFKGLAIGFEYDSKELDIRTAFASTSAAAEKAADYLKTTVKGFEKQASGLSMMLGQGAEKAVKEVFESFKAKAVGDFLKVRVEIPELLLEMIASRLSGLAGILSK